MEHPFWIVGRGWIQARYLKSDDLLLSRKRETIPIKSIESRKGIFTVYNIEVEGFHTYFVSKKEVLVHNKAARNNNPTPPSIYDSHGKLRILQASELDNAAKELKKELKSDLTVALARVVNVDGSITMAVATNGGGQISKSLSELIKKSDGWERVSRNGFSSIHAEERIIAKYGNSVEADTVDELNKEKLFA